MQRGNSLRRHGSSKSAYACISRVRHIPFPAAYSDSFATQPMGSSHSASAFSVHPLIMLLLVDSLEHIRKNHPILPQGMGKGFPIPPPNLPSLFHYGLGTVLCFVFNSIESQASFVPTPQVRTQPFFPPVFYLSSTASVVLDIRMKTVKSS